MLDDDPFAALPRENEPPAALRDRVLRDLRHRGLVRSGPPPVVRHLLGLAAAAALFFAGMAVGGRHSKLPASAGYSYALLLYPPANPGAPMSHDGTVAEYSAWAQGLGRQVSAGAAFGEERVVGGQLTGQSATGYFIIHAGNWDEALAIVRNSPHVRRGGVVAVHAMTQ